MACNTVLKRLPAVIRVLEEISEENNGDRTVDALWTTCSNRPGIHWSFSNLHGALW